MPALSLKTKLVFAITAMVVAIVATLATVYISEVVHQRIHEIYQVADVIKLHVFAVSKPALGVDLSSTKVDLNDPIQFRRGGAGFAAIRSQHHGPAGISDR